MTTHAEIDLSSEQALNAFRNAFQRHSAGVAIITLNNVDGSPVGFTATSLASLSARPPMLTFNTATTASSWPGLRDTDHVAIHMLGVRNHKLATIMAGPAPQRFVGDHWHRGEFNLPVLDDVTAVLVAKIVARNEINQAASIVAEVIDGFQGNDDDGLLYRERRYLAPRPLDGQD
ncbi:flavin reductase family protein [Lysinibacter cavernae]|uniref:Flavin reductase (DIM6/NTAB) family NADH-FMN oxidoreductase RutF n=1 Tax=Lysinibacter cavernae TaxID=1640652 RepID=A0A7X5QZI2_9MICO|nr:flavin reductase family protein [Lysinibacter cavernae]NIH52752.1 flavin reductase (DIM6/NTAB) family NADH-FMN oxidoreductase RutF [Lysinibacter cavernae]